MKALTLADILPIDDLPVEQVSVPQWSGTVGVRHWRADERSDVEKEFSKRKPSDDPGAFRRAVLRRSLVDPNGQPLLPDDEAAKALMKKSADAVEFLFEEACKRNGLRKKDVEDIEKNSQTPQAGSSPTD